MPKQAKTKTPKEPVHDFQWAIKQIEQKKWVARDDWRSAFSMGMNPSHTLAMFEVLYNLITKQTYLRELPVMLPIEDLTATDWIEVPCQLRELNWTAAVGPRDTGVIVVYKE